VADGRITVLNASATMARFMRRGAPDPELFRETVGTLMRQLAGSAPAGLYVYGEMVDLLAEEGNFHAAEQLEALWNELGTQCAFTLLCGYFAPHFAAPGAGNALDSICRAHSHVRTSAADPLGTWLIATDSPNSKPIIAS
jgi:hypothetical protein